MRKVEKLALAGVILLLLLCALSFVLVFFSDSGRSSMNAFFQFRKAEVDLRSLDRRLPFATPERGLVGEGRLRLFIEVCRQVKPAADPVEAYERDDREGSIHSHEVVYEGAPISLCAAFLERMATALQAGQMGPSEWQWIANQVEFARSGREGNGDFQRLQELATTLRKSSQDPALPLRERKRLEREVQRLEEVAPANGPAAEANAALIARYADQIKASAVGKRARGILNAVLLAGPGQGKVPVFTGDPEGSGPPPAPPAASGPPPLTRPGAG